MSIDQKNSYLKAHMDVQQHMQQVSMQTCKSSSMINGQTANSLNHNMNNLSHQSISNLNLSNSYSNANTIKVPQITSSNLDHSFVGNESSSNYENGGARVLQNLGNWSSDIPLNVPRPNLIPFIEPYIEGGSMHPASRLKALQQVQQASQNPRKTNPSKCKRTLIVKHFQLNWFYSVLICSSKSLRMYCVR